MNRLIAGLLVTVVGFLALAPLRAAEAAAKGKIRVLLTRGGLGYDEKHFCAILDALGDVQYKMVTMPQAAEMLKPGLEKDYDVIVMYDMVKQISPAQQKAFIALLNQGIGLVSLHHNLWANQNWDEFRRIIGGRTFNKAQEIDGKKYGPSGYSFHNQIKVTVADKEHPITRGLADFTIVDELNKNYYVAPDVKVLLTTDHRNSDPAQAWVKQYGKSRVFFLMFGHDNTAYQCPAYPVILGRGIRWAAGREPVGK